MTAREFKTRLAADDKLAVVMQALFELDGAKARNIIVPKCFRGRYQDRAAHILAALASAGVKK